jgi:hypothetical protein
MIGSWSVVDKPWAAEDEANFGFGIGDFGYRYLWEAPQRGGANKGGDRLSECCWGAR